MVGKHDQYFEPMFVNFNTKQFFHEILTPFRNGDLICKPIKVNDLT